MCLEIGWEGEGSDKLGRLGIGHIYTIMCKQIASGKLLYRIKELGYKFSVMRKKGGIRWIEWWEGDLRGRDIFIHKADSRCCTTETNIIVPKSISHKLKKNHNNELILKQWDCTFHFLIAIRI